MGNCMQKEGKNQRPVAATSNGRSEMEHQNSAGPPSVQYTNSGHSLDRIGNKRSNTITALDHEQTLTTGDRQHSFGSATKTILSDQDIFSREAIRVAHQFWNDNLMILPMDRRQEIGVTLYAQMFRMMPQCRKIFLRGDIEKTSEKFFGMIGWLIMELHASNNEVWAKAKVLGKAHKKWGISYEHYLPMLQAFHVTFQEQFPKLYTLRVKFCIENLFMNCAKIMTGKDFVTLFAERVQDLESLEFLDSLDACLAHKTGREYFERYLEQTFCAEYVSFLRAFDEFKQLGNSQQRYEKAKTIYIANFRGDSEAPIELNTEEQREHIVELKQELDKYQEVLNNDTEEEQSIELHESLLDVLYADVKQIIEENSWDKFHSGIYSIKQATRIKSF
eukprot:547553_1